MNKIVLEFEAGGACWSAATCALPIYTGSVSVAGHQKKLNSANSGIHDSNNAKNPLSEWTHVFMPYCTGDTFTGNQTKHYLTGKVNHFGKFNAQAGLDYLTNNYPDADATLTTGCSAGSLG